MQEPAKVRVSPVNDGLEDFFVSDSQDMVTTEAVGVLTVSVQEAAKLLAITERSVWRRIRAKRLHSKQHNGKTFVLVPSADVSVTRHDAPTEMSVTTTDDKPVTEVAGLLELLREKDRELQAAVFRNGYLESQLEERQKEVKLLTDSQHRGSWWRRFGAWWMGKPSV